jgi:hypothetical protein
LEWLESIQGGNVTAEAAVKAILEGAKLERLARGEPTGRQEIKGEFETRLEELSDGELHAILDSIHEGLGAGTKATSG